MRKCPRDWRQAQAEVLAARPHADLKDEPRYFLTGTLAGHRYSVTDGAETLDQSPYGHDAKGTAWKAAWAFLFSEQPQVRNRHARDTHDRLLKALSR